MELPTDILLHIFSFISPEQLLPSRLVCTAWRDVIDSDIVWRRNCRRQYRLVENTPWGEFTFKELYFHFLKPYACLEGLWVMLAPPYGGLVQVKVQSNSLVGFEFFSTSKSVQDPLTPLVLFSVEADELQRYRVCVDGSKNPSLRKVSDHQEIHIENVADSATSSRLEQLLSVSASDNELENFLANLRLSTLVSAHKQNVLRLRRLSTAGSNERWLHVITPGLYKAFYPCHGTEILQVDINEDTVQGFKIVGDPNVPAGQMSFRAFLKQPLLLDAESQRTMRSLEQSTPCDALPDTEQPFQVPEYCHDGLQEGWSFPLPRHCRWRFLGHGQIAEHGFKNPAFIAGHWIVFDQNTFAFMWLQLNSMTVYLRMQESDLVTSRQ